MRRRFVFAALAALTLASSAEAQQADIIRGRVIGPDSMPIEGAVVTATTLSGNVSRQARTNRDGRYTITHPAGEGDYMLTFAALGFAARRYEIKRMADEEVLVADARLTRVNTLETVRVAAPRATPNRNEPPVDVGGTEQAIANQALPAADLGDLAAMAATLPGVQLVPGENGDANGYSVLGLGADQNATTLNGMSFGGSNLPRDAGVATSLNTSPYDVSRGGFSGGNLNIRTRSGSNFRTRGLSFNLDAPQLQWTDRAAQALGQQYSNLSLGGMASGPVQLNRTFYNMSFQAGRRANDFQSPLNTDEVGLQTAGVAFDSVARFLGILSGQGIPITVASAPGNRHVDQGSVFGGLDWAPASSTSGQAFSINFNGNVNRQNPLFAQATMLPTAIGERQAFNGGMQARHTGYLRQTIFTETTLGFGAQSNESEPYLEVPSGRVRVSSVFDDGTSGVTSLAFGGSNSLGARSTNRSAGALNQLSWISMNNKHRVKLTSEIRHESYEQNQANNAFGTFSFNSLADLEAGRPSSYTRQLTQRTSSAAQLIAGASLGDAWRPKRDVQVQYGVRVDGNRFLDTPSHNAQVETLLGVRNDRVPNRVYVSPRLGFSWTYGAAQQIAGFEGAARAPRAVIRGGVGLFQGTPGTQSIGAALDNTGLPSGIQQLVCVGASAPVPDWDAYASNPATIPSTCAGGSATFSSTAPNVSLFAKDYSAPRSVRSNLTWSGAILGNRFSTSLEATYSANLNQASQVDLNFNPTQRFTLADEANRPVFSDASRIVPATGSIASTASRVSTLFSRVTESRSDLRSESRQLAIRLAPTRFSTHLNWNVAYVLSNVREQVRGFGQGNTVGNPLDVTWSQSPFDSRHQFTYSVGYNFFDAVRVDWFGQFRSGTPFTPMVAGDVNGDGWSNDRAYIYDPATTVSPELASAMQSVLDDGSRIARECLGRQVGQLAGRNSCRGPWTSTATMSISFNPAKIRMPQRASISFQLSNPLGAADLMMNGSGNLRGWGQAAQADPNLLYVRGFDPATNRFSYEVNRRFGATDPQRSAFRQPTTLTAMVRVDVGPTRERQILEQQLDRGRRTSGDRMPEMMFRAMLSGGGLPNPFATILRQQDSLKLTTKQADSIATLNRRYTTRSDSIWAPVAKYFGELPNRYDDDEAYDRYLAARRATVDMLAFYGPQVKSLLTPEQYRKLPPLVASVLEPRYLASIRSGTVTFTGGRGFAAPGGGGGGGGGQTVIIRQ